MAAHSRSLRDPRADPDRRRGYGLSRVPTGFIPIEDQGYLLVAVQLPDGASLERTQHVLDQVSEIAGKTPGVDQVISIAGISALDNSFEPRQCRRRLSDPEGVERARRRARICARCSSD